MTRAQEKLVRIKPENMEKLGSIMGVKNVNPQVPHISPLLIPNTAGPTSLLKL